MKILIIQTAFIGDVILTTPLIKHIHLKYPSSIIDFMTIPASYNLLQRDPNLNEVIIFDKRGSDRGYKGFRRMMKKMKSGNYNICICPHRSLRSAILTYSTGADIRIGFNNSGWKGAFNQLINYDQSFHETQRNLALLQVLDIDTLDTRPVIFTDNRDAEFVEENLINQLQGKSGKFFAIAPGSVWATKKWPTDHFKSVIQELEINGFQVILVGGPQDAEICENLIQNSQTRISFAGKLTLRQTKYLFTKCAGLLSNDSAPLHLGLAANIPVFGIFGPTIRQFGFAPIESNSYLIDNENLNCRPCGIHGSHKCPTKTFDCMENIESDKVSELILSILN